MKKAVILALVGLMLVAIVGCTDTSPLALDVSFLTSEQQTQWTQIQEKNPGLVSYVKDEAYKGIVNGYPATRLSDIRKAIQSVEMSQSDQDMLLAVMGYSSATRSAYMGEFLARDITDSAMRDTVLIRVVDGYADFNRNDAFRVLDMIQGKDAKDAAYAKFVD